MVSFGFSNVYKAYDPSVFEPEFHEEAEQLAVKYQDVLWDEENLSGDLESVKEFIQYNRAVQKEINEMHRLKAEAWKKRMSAANPVESKLFQILKEKDLFRCFHLDLLDVLVVKFSCVPCEIKNQLLYLFKIIFKKDSQVETSSFLVDWSSAHGEASFESLGLTAERVNLLFQSKEAIHVQSD